MFPDSVAGPRNRITIQTTRKRLCRRRICELVIHRDHIRVIQIAVDALGDNSQRLFGFVGTFEFLHPGIEILHFMPGNATRRACCGADAGAGENILHQVKHHRLQLNPGLCGLRLEIAAIQSSSERLSCRHIRELVIHRDHVRVIQVAMDAVGDDAQAFDVLGASIVTFLPCVKIIHFMPGNSTYGHLSISSFLGRDSICNWRISLYQDPRRQIVATRRFIVTTSVWRGRIRYMCFLYWSQCEYTRRNSPPSLCRSRVR